MYFSSLFLFLGNYRGSCRGQFEQFGPIKLDASGQLILSAAQKYLSERPHPHPPSGTCCACIGGNGNEYAGYYMLYVV